MRNPTLQQLNFDGNVIENEDCPNVEQHAKHWNLNEKQRQAFLLTGAALLQHIYASLKSNLTLTTKKVKRLNKTITNQLEILLSACNQF